MPDLVAAAPVVVTAPATTANLGPGFDTFGLALGLRDRVVAQITSGRLQLDVTGQGATAVPRDESHLVVRALRAAFDLLGVTQPGLKLTCQNSIPHGRGLGSSSAAIVSGIRLAESMVDGAQFSDAQALTLAAELEGHPDNVAACLFGGFTIAWQGPTGVHATRLDVHPLLRVVVFTAPEPLSTGLARGLLPTVVGHDEAAANAARAALLVVALTSCPEHLLAATEDRLHQEFRRVAMPQSMSLVDDLRAAGHAAVVSGAGPSVLLLGSASVPVDGARWAPPQWQQLWLDIDPSGARIER